ncbi:MAG TPA: hypothetical protein ENK18_13295 [Deltaproteobacteria bacterium]|nr:hypothetical protein [Deltaproteobacteria bacterium]
MRGRIFAALLVGMIAGTAGAVAFAESTSGPGGRRAAGNGLQDLAGRLNARERALDRRERSLHDREQDLRDAEARLKERLGELSDVRAEIDGLLAELDAVEESRRVALTEMTEKMRPKEAGPFLGAMDEVLAVDLLDRMQTSKAGKILAVMPPPKAARLAEQLTAPITLEQR